MNATTTSRKPLRGAGGRCPAACAHADRWRVLLAALLDAFRLAY